jgi:hypothetical protein
MKKLLIIIPAVLSLSQGGLAQWNANPAINNAIAVTPYDQQDVKIATDSKGGAIITWLDYRADATMAAGDIYAQRIDKDGVIKWSLNGVAICTHAADQVGPVIQEDGLGGAVIAWEDMRNGTKDIYAQHIDSSGNVLWAADGVSVVTKMGIQVNPRLCSDGGNGALAVWEDDSTGLGDENIFAQHITTGGGLTWGTSGVAVCKLSTPQINPRLVVDGAGGALICWQDKRNGSDYDIYVQKVNASGISQWTASGVALCLLAGTQSNPKMVSDFAGGAIIAWQDKRTGIDLDIYAQYVNSAGSPQWTSGGKLISNATGSQSAIDMTADASIGGAILTWKDSRNGNFDVYGQKISLAGAVQWTGNGIAIVNSANDQMNPNIVPDGAGGGIVTWQDSLTGNYDIRAQRLSSSGALLWAAGGVSIGTAAFNQTSPKNVGDGSGGSIYAFQDKRSGDFDVYAFKTDANGVPVSVKEMQDKPGLLVYPNPAKEAVTISAPSFTEGFVISVYDAMGRKLAEESVPGGSSYTARQKFAGGVYWFRLSHKEKSVSGKFIIEN